MARQDSALMRLPSEIRLMIYDYLFDDKGNDTLAIRHENPSLYHQKEHRRRSYRIIGSGLLRQSQLTTYEMTTDVDFHPSILRVNRKIYQEASHKLYAAHTFDFGKDIEGVVPFFSDLTPQTRCLIPEISLIKRGSVYCRDYDRCEWSTLCGYLRDDMQLRSMRLVVEGGKPSLGWAGLPTYSVGDYKTLSMVKYEALEWVWELLSIKGLRQLDIVPQIHHCPPSHSAGMAFFASFSATIDTEFASFLRSEMLAV
ncbi:autophagy-related protein 3 [Phlyctema vagabunda]|uniref:Autophagy-related protein 3 n=1 Tax=Phlyctema vagabunda TaxID=108571 RepID=A0ABR4PWW9_9HELO